MRALSRSILLGAGASLALMSGAQAADLPMKAKAPAVQYVKVCSLYGAGYYYIPGTDTCLKIGGHIRVDAYVGPSAAADESVNYNANYNLAGQRQFFNKVRAFATFDARSQTEYGTLRSYFLFGINADNDADGDGASKNGGGNGAGAYTYRAFVQLAGFTWGLANSIFDAYSITPIHMNYVVATNGSIGASGIWQWRYTAQFGGGLSASIAAEEPHRRINPIIGSVHEGATWPDFVGQIKAAGAWGYVQAAAAVKNASAVNPLIPTATIDAVGWAASVGGLLKVPGMPGDNFGFQFTYANGANQYVTQNARDPGVYAAATLGLPGAIAVRKGASSAYGLITDGVITGAGALDLTTAWGFEAGYEHHWSKTLKTSLAGGYVSIEYDSAASLALGCPVVLGHCANTSFYNIGSRTQWSPVPNFSLALDVLYTHIDSIGTLAAASISPGGIAATGLAADKDIWTGMVRVRRDFWP